MQVICSRVLSCAPWCYCCLQIFSRKSDNWRVSHPCEWTCVSANEPSEWTWMGTENIRKVSPQCGCTCEPWGCSTVRTPSCTPCTHRWFCRSSSAARRAGMQLRGSSFSVLSAFSAIHPRYSFPRFDWSFFRQFFLPMSVKQIPWTRLLNNSSCDCSNWCSREKPN